MNARKPQKERRGKKKIQSQQLAIGQTLEMALRPAMRRGGRAYSDHLWWMWQLLVQLLLRLLRGLVKRVVHGIDVSLTAVRAEQVETQV